MIAILFDRICVITRVNAKRLILIFVISIHFQTKFTSQTKNPESCIMDHESWSPCTWPRFPLEYIWCEISYQEGKSNERTISSFKTSSRLNSQSPPLWSLGKTALFMGKNRYKIAFIWLDNIELIKLQIKRSRLQ